MSSSNTLQRQRAIRIKYMTAKHNDIGIFVNAVTNGLLLARSTEAEQPKPAEVRKLLEVAYVYVANILRHHQSFQYVRPRHMTGLQANIMATIGAIEVRVMIHAEHQAIQREVVLEILPSDGKDPRTTSALSQWERWGNI